MLGMDHMEILGNTVEEIAAEKAGIIKEGVPCFSCPQSMHPSTRSVLISHATRNNTGVLFLDPHVFPVRSWPPLAIGGKHAVENSKLAFALARHYQKIPLPMPMIKREWDSLMRATFIGRSQCVKVTDDVTMYLDGAHNVESLMHANEWFFNEVAAHSAPPPIKCSPVKASCKPVENDAHLRRNVVLLYCTRDPHDVVRSFSPHQRRIHHCIFTTVEHPKQSSGDAQVEDEERVRALASLWRSDLGVVPCSVHLRPFASWEELSKSIRENVQGPVNLYVTGSFFLVGEVLNLARKVFPEILPDEE
jgi:folylpolyglutamate synthase